MSIRSYGSGLLMKLFGFFVLSFFSLNLNSAVIAVMDSMFDIKHESLKDSLWVNIREIPNNRKDDDENGYIDDVHGISLGDKYNSLFYEKLFIKQDDNIERIFNIRSEYDLGRYIPREDISWYNSILRDKRFREKINNFMYAVHGTHVAAIAVKDNPYAELLCISNIIKNEEILIYKKDVRHIINNLVVYAEKDFINIFNYANNNKTKVVNLSSFRFHFSNLPEIIKDIYKKISKDDYTEDELNRDVSYFQQLLIKSSDKLFDNFSNILFILAAGNDAMDIDSRFISYPTYSSARNKVVVAATLDNIAFASFSNYNKDLVNIAAPGVAINSATPRGLFLRVSGTSESSPYVANVATYISHINPDLSPNDIKKILLGTVDKKAFLVSKVSSQGVINRNRALIAAELSKSYSLDYAIEQSLREVRDIPVVFQHYSFDNKVSNIPYLF